MNMEKYNDLPVYRLDIVSEQESDVEVDFVALVDKPAIQRQFMTFNADDFVVNPGASESEDEFIQRCMGVLVGDEGKDQDQAYAICQSKWDNRDRFAESYSDYPDAVKNNAKAALKWAEENGWGSCGTPVGKIRANQLANGEPITLETIKRMYSFLSRHKENAATSKGYGDGCGQLMYDAWGGASALTWAESKIRQAEKKKFAIQSEEERIVTGPLMLADTPIFRVDSFGEYYVYFTADTIKQIAQKFFKKGYQSNVNLMHDGEQKVDGVTMFESWIVDKKRGIQPMAGFEDVPDGSWFGSFKVENDEVWNDIKAGKFKGFSVEGVFNYVRQNDEQEAAEKMRKVVDILNQYRQMVN